MIDMMTMPEGARTLMSSINLALCLFLMWSCVCRIHLMSARTTRLRFRIGYVLVFVLAASSGFSPSLWGEIPGPGQIGMAVGFIYLVGAGFGAWRHGQPDYAKRPGVLS